MSSNKDAVDKVKKDAKILKVDSQALAEQRLKDIETNVNNKTREIKETIDTKRQNLKVNAKQKHKEIKSNVHEKTQDIKQAVDKKRKDGKVEVETTKEVRPTPQGSFFEKLFGTRQQPSNGSYELNGIKDGFNHKLDNFRSWLGGLKNSSRSRLSSKVDKLSSAIDSVLGPAMAFTEQDIEDWPEYTGLTVFRQKHIAQETNKRNKT